jgi:TIR domain
VHSIVLCYAREDEVFARHLAGFLEINLTVAVSRDEGLVGPNIDLLEATERALSADAALVLLSPSSVPKVWNRRIWEPLFFSKPKEFQTLLGFVLLSDCTFPDLLRRGRFFDASSDGSQALRELKRWLLWPHVTVSPVPQAVPELEGIRQAVVDRPGTAAGLAPEFALRFATEFKQDFEAVYRFDCHRRSRAGIMGDIGSTLGLQMSGTLEENRSNLGAWSAHHRVLFVLADVNPEDRDFVNPGGRASMIFTGPAPGGLPGALPCGAADAVRKFEQIVDVDVETGLRLGWIAVNLLKAQERFTEASEVLDAMAQAARDLGDTSNLLRIEREQFWTPGYQGDNLQRPGEVWQEQLMLPFIE